ncbi:MAG: hypothetical protein LJE57_05100 [Gallionella sp.]|nr:hypothetical protein [Gallionella sp.]
MTMPIANKVTLVYQSTCCGVLALHHYRRNKTNLPRSIGTIPESMRSMAAGNQSRIQLPYQTFAARTMMRSRYARSTMQAAAAQIQVANQSRDQAVT